MQFSRISASTKANKLFWASISPLIWLVVVFAFFLGTEVVARATPRPVPASLFAVFAFGLWAAVLGCFVWVVFDALRSKRWGWSAAILISGGLLLPVYGFFVLRRRPGLRGTAALVPVVLVAALGFACSEDWGHPEIQSQLGGLQTPQIAEASVTKDGFPRTSLATDDLEQLVAQLRELEPALTIGEKGPWQEFCEIRIDAQTAGRFRVTIATRPSLKGNPTAILAEDKTQFAERGFYDGHPLHQWLVGRGYCGSSAPPI